MNTSKDKAVEYKLNAIEKMYDGSHFFFNKLKLNYLRIIQS